MNQATLAYNVENLSIESNLKFKTKSNIVDRVAQSV
jgi:hypothetical protein